MAPRGTRIVQCMHCFKEFTCGDAIYRTCPECREKGHTDRHPCTKCMSDNVARGVITKMALSGNWPKEHLQQMWDDMGLDRAQSDNDPGDRGGKAND